MNDILVNIDLTVGDVHYTQLQYYDYNESDDVVLVLVKDENDKIDAHENIILAQDLGEGINQLFFDYDWYDEQSHITRSKEELDSIKGFIDRLVEVGFINPTDETFAPLMDSPEYSVYDILNPTKLNNL